MTDTHEKFMDDACELLIVAGAEYFNAYYEEGEPGELYENGLVVTLAPHVARALSQAHQDGIREGKRQAAEIARGTDPDGTVYFTAEGDAIADAILSTIQDEAE